ncbi:mobile mystery protein A [Pseudoduganella sp. R-34]|uniref:mobile mystery protein A n=1 Tax=unclassified Pseudoduganella TaxID=2637179 RepID=UPI003CF19636
MDIKKLQLGQLSEALRGVHIPPRPPVGWIQSIRKTVGMTTRQLAERMGVAQSTVVAMEQSEKGGTITLDSLHRAAEALDCELRYVLVPRQELQTKVEQQATIVAKRNIAKVAHTMSLENQEPSDKFKNSLLNEEKERIMRGRWGKLWDR